MHTDQSMLIAVRRHQRQLHLSLVQERRLPDPERPAPVSSGGMPVQLGLDPQRRRGQRTELSLGLPVQGRRRHGHHAYPASYVTTGVRRRETRLTSSSHRQQVRYAQRFVKLHGRGRSTALLVPERAEQQPSRAVRPSLLLVFAPFVCLLSSSADNNEYGFTNGAQTNLFATVGGSTLSAAPSVSSSEMGAGPSSSFVGPGSSSLASIAPIAQSSSSSSAVTSAQPSVSLQPSTTNTPGKTCRPRKRALDRLAASPELRKRHQQRADKRATRRAVRRAGSWA